MKNLQYDRNNSAEQQTRCLLNIVGFSLNNFLKWKTVNNATYSLNRKNVKLKFFLQLSLQGLNITMIKYN